MPKNNSVCVIIPAFNEEKSVVAVINSVRNINNEYDIILINDGSTDSTKEIAEKENVVVINLVFNLGIGAAVQTGLKYAYRNGYAIAVQVDADGQHPASFIPILINVLTNEGCDLVIGSRFLTATNYKGSLFRRLGTLIFSKLIRLVTGVKIYDSTSGFRAFNRKTMVYLTENYPIEFPEPASIVKLLKNKFRIKEIPAELQNRKAGKSSVTKIRALKYMLAISIAILIEALRMREIQHE